MRLFGRMTEEQKRLLRSPEPTKEQSIAFWEELLADPRITTDERRSFEIYLEKAKGI